LPSSAGKLATGFLVNGMRHVLPADKQSFASHSLCRQSLASAFFLQAFFRFVHAVQVHCFS
jgi:hypothetical protein